MTNEKWLIDANALKDALRTEDGAYALGHSVHRLFCVDEIIDNLPIIDAVEVVHGRWIWRNGKCFCSACSKQGEPKQVYQDGTVDEYSYCPNCGAKMDLE